MDDGNDDCVDVVVVVVVIVLSFLSLFFVSLMTILQSSLFPSFFPIQVVYRLHLLTVFHSFFQSFHRCCFFTISILNLFVSLFSFNIECVSVCVYLTRLPQHHVDRVCKSKEDRRRNRDCRPLLTLHFNCNSLLLKMYEWFFAQNTYYRCTIAQSLCIVYSVTHLNTYLYYCSNCRQMQKRAENYFERNTVPIWNFRCGISSERAMNAIDTHRFYPTYLILLILFYNFHWLPRKQVRKQCFLKQNFKS